MDKRAQYLSRRFDLGVVRKHQYYRSVPLWVGFFKCRALTLPTLSLRPLIYVRVYLTAFLAFKSQKNNTEPVDCSKYLNTNKKNNHSSLLHSLYREPTNSIRKTTLESVNLFFSHELQDQVC